MALLQNTALAWYPHTGHFCLSAALYWPNILLSVWLKPLAPALCWSVIKYRAMWPLRHKKYSHHWDIRSEKRQKATAVLCSLHFPRRKTALSNTREACDRTVQRNTWWATYNLVTQLHPLYNLAVCILATVPSARYSHLCPLNRKRS